MTSVARAHDQPSAVAPSDVSRLSLMYGLNNGKTKNKINKTKKKTLKTQHLKHITFVLNK